MTTPDLKDMKNMAQLIVPLTQALAEIRQGIMSEVERQGLEHSKLWGIFGNENLQKAISGVGFAEIVIEDMQAFLKEFRLFTEGSDVH